MRRALLVTAREYRRMMNLPAFWVISLIVPLFVLAAPVESRLFRKSQTVGYVLVDKSGSYARQINRRLELDYQGQVLGQLLAYAQEWRAGSAVPGVAALPEAGSASSSAVSDAVSDAVVQNFVATGGTQTVLRLMKSRLLPRAPAFEAPPRPFAEIPLPEGVATDSTDRFGASIGPHFGETFTTLADKAGLGVAVYIPDNVDSGGQVRVWTDGSVGAALVQDVRRELTQSLRLRALRAAGVDAQSAARIESLSAPLSISPAQTATPSGNVVVHSTLPLALAGLLMISTMITGSMMLQGLIEERSNKLLEAVLACVSPRELMVGKLLGIWAIGLTIVGIWAGATIGIASAEPSSPLGFLVPAVASLGQTPWMVASMIFYFLAGYLTLGMIFLAVGVLSDSMQEAQAYLTPLMFVIVAPAAGLGSVIFRDPNGLLPHIFSWIPLHTPVTMLARLQGGMSSFEIMGTSAALLGFGAIELWLLGRLFENHLISTGWQYSPHPPGETHPPSRRLFGRRPGCRGGQDRVATQPRAGGRRRSDCCLTRAWRERLQDFLRQLPRPGCGTRAEPRAVGLPEARGGRQKPDDRRHETDGRGSQRRRYPGRRHLADQPVTWGLVTA